MGTRWLCTSVNKKHKNQKTRGTDMEEDMISQLPDEILLSIMSHLTITEAARTSLLARRWRKVWTFIPSLNFDASQILFSQKGSARHLRHVYVRLVNCVLDAYQGCTLDEFQVRFDLNKKYTTAIHRWFNFAIEKRVKRLVMDFSCHCGPFQISLPPVSHTAEFPDFRSLTDIQLKRVNISGGVIEHFISTCPYLEKLYIDGSKSLVDLNVFGPSLCLKYLKIKFCFALKSIYLYATNILSFKYQGPMIGIFFANVPNLVEVSVRGGYSVDNPHDLYQLLTGVSRLETLTLSVQAAEKSIALLEFPVLAHLKNLTLKVGASDDDSILVFAPLIRAAPSLHRLVLDLTSNRILPIRRTRAKKGSKCPHQCLKVVEINGFVGQIVDMEFAMYLIKNAIMLEKIIINPPTFKLDFPWNVKYMKRRKQAGREGAMLLKSKFSLGEKLVLCNF